MPRASKESIYASPSRPQRSGSKQLTGNLSKDEFMKRLKNFSQDLMDVDQGARREELSGLAENLGKKFIIKHADRDIRFHAAFCLAHILRIFAPDPPYDKDQLWSIFDLIISQLEGLRNPKGTKGITFEKFFNLLETLAMVNIMGICVQMDFTDLVLKFFKIMFSNFRDELSKKLLTYTEDIMCRLLSESESISQQLLDSILENIIEPKKTSSQCAYKLACGVIQRAAPAIEPYIQMFFNNALFFEKSSDSLLESNLYSSIHELHKICPSVLLSVLPQLEFKLKSENESERLEVTKLLADMFSDEDSDLARSHKMLWQSFLGRFVDINTDVRVECTKSAKNFFFYHPELVDEISEKLRERQRDPDERVRMEVVTTICSVASNDVSSVSRKLFDIVTERLRDRKFHVRKDTMTSLGHVYKKILRSDVNNNLKKISWIPTKIMHCYYQNSADDRMAVERVFFDSLVPVSLGSKQRMKRMLALYQSLDGPGIKAFNHMLRSQASLRSDMIDILRYWQEHQKTSTEEAKRLVTAKIPLVARVLPDSLKTQDHLKRLTKMLSDKKLFQLLKICLGSEHDCAKVAKAVSEIVVKIGAKNPVFETVKALLDRTAQLLIDTSAAKQLVTLVSKYVENENFDDEEDDDEEDEDVEAGNSSQDEIGLKGRKALDLLLTCVTVFPTEFKFSLIYELTLQYLKRKDFVVDIALRILAQIGGGLLDVGSSVSSHFQKILTQLFTTGTPSQVKLAGRAINKIYPNSSAIFERVLKNELKSLRYESSRLVSTLSALGQIALLEPSVFDPHNTTVIRDFVVKDLFVKDRSKPSKSPNMMWCDEGELSKEIKAKIQSIKLLVNWLCGLETKEKNRVLPVLRMLDNVLKRDGDITSGGRIRNCEMSHMRLAAACAILKLAQDLECHEFIDFEFFLMLSSVMQDPCSNVRELFIKKLCRGLESFKLPLEYLTLFALSASESSKERKRQIKQMICRSINVRNEYLKQYPSGTVRPASVLPEYALPYLIYLLAHLPHIDYNKRERLREVKAYLWFFMEPVLARGDNYNFMKKLAENVKQTKDARAPDDEEANKAIYTVCDISIGIIMNLSKTHTFLLKDFPGNLVLPKKLFVPLAKGEGNNKSYLPKGFSVSPVKKTSTVPKVTPTKSTSSTKSSGPSNKKKSAVDKTVRRVSETSKTKTKKTQKALLDLLNKKTEGSDEDSDEEEDETPRKKGRSTRKETIPEPSSPETSPSPARKCPLSSPALASPKSPKEKRTRKATTTAIKEENPTRFSPRKNSKSSSGEENIVRNTRATDSFDQDVTVNVFSQSPAQDSSSQGSSKTKSPVKETTKRNKEPDPLDESEDMVSSKTRSPVKKQKTLEDQPAPLKQSSIIVKRKRKRK